MIFSLLELYIAPESHHDVIETLKYINGPTKVKPGFINCRILKDLENSNSLTILEEWESRQDLCRHIRSIDFRATLALMEMSITHPELRIYTVSEVEGLETVYEVREGNA